MRSAVQPFWPASPKSSAVLVLFRHASVYSKFAEMLAFLHPWDSGRKTWLASRNSTALALPPSLI